MTTATKIIRLSLKDAGAFGQGQTPTGEDFADCLTTLNDMIAQWATQRWLIYHLVQASVTSTGANSYTVGPQCDFDLAVRPDKIESAFLRQLTQSQPNQVDWPLRIIQSREEYNQIAIKQLSSFTRAIFYDSSWDTGTLYPYPVPSASIYAIHISVKALLSEITEPNTEIDLPPIYNAAMRYNLGMRLRAMYPVSPPPGDVLPGLARNALNVLRSSTFQVGQMQMPSELVRPGIYNIFSDQSY